MIKAILKLIIIVVLLFVVSHPAFSSDQTPSFEDKYSDKDAIFLRDDISLELKEDWSYVTHLHKKVKILKEGAKQLGEIPLDYEKGRDVIRIISANTITPDGKKHRYSKIQDLNVYSDYPMYSDAMVKVITFPEVNIGSIIEFEAEVVSNGMPIKNAFWDSFSFDYARPALEANTKVTLPKKLNVVYREFNAEYKPQITETAKTITYTWKLQNVAPAEKSEEYLPMPTPESFRNTVEFSSIQSWEDISRWYYSLVQKNLKFTNDIENVAKEACKNYSTVKDKTRAILEYVQDNFRYVSMSFGENSLEPHPTDEIFCNKYGDCKDLSLLCMAMLKAVGIESNVVLFNNEFSISEPKFDLPFPSLFDHVILLIEDKSGSFYADPLLDGYDIGEFPLSYQGAYTFIINDNGGRFDQFPIFDEKRSSTKTAKNVTIREDGSALFENTHLWELGSSVDMRKTMKAMDKEAEDKFYQTLDAYLTSGGEMIERHIDGLDKKYGLIEGHSKYTSKDAFTLDGNMMIIDVAGYGRDFDFTKKERKHPIFHPANSLVEELTTYKIPKGFSIIHLPKNIYLKQGFFEMSREYQRSGDAVTIKESTRLKRSQYPKEDYQKFKDFFDKLPSQTQQRIVLKKGKSWQQKLKEIWTIIRQ